MLCFDTVNAAATIALLCTLAALNLVTCMRQLSVSQRVLRIADCRCTTAAVCTA
jgi:hypothetical protein